MIPKHKRHTLSINAEVFAKDLAIEQLSAIQQLPNNLKMSVMAKSIINRYFKNLLDLGSGGYIKLDIHKILMLYLVIVVKNT